jgi:hypothetical protein
MADSAEPPTRPCLKHKLFWFRTSSWSPAMQALCNLAAWSPTQCYVLIVPSRASIRAPQRTLRSAILCDHWPRQVRHLTTLDASPGRPPPVAAPGPGPRTALSAVTSAPTFLPTHTLQPRQAVVRQAASKQFCPQHTQPLPVQPVWTAATRRRVASCG